jgi:hypothetical protein
MRGEGSVVERPLAREVLRAEAPIAHPNHVTAAIPAVIIVCPCQIEPRSSANIMHNFTCYRYVIAPAVCRRHRSPIARHQIVVCR